MSATAPKINTSYHSIPISDVENSTLIALGWEALPIITGGKAPLYGGWQSMPIGDLPSKRDWVFGGNKNPDFDRFIGRDHQNIGIRTGTVAVMDNDTLDAGLASNVNTIINKILGRPVLHRVGSKPGGASFYRIDAPIGKLSVYGFSKDADGKDIKHLFEILGTGNQVVCFGDVDADPKKGTPAFSYTWKDGQSPANTPVSDLGLITLDKVLEALREVEYLYFEHGLTNVTNTSVQIERDTSKLSAVEGDPISENQLLSMLKCIDPNRPRQGEGSWTAVAGSLSRLNVVQDGKPLDHADKCQHFTDWSRAADNFESDEDCERAYYDMAKPSKDGVGAGTLIWLARQGGFKEIPHAPISSMVTKNALAEHEAYVQSQMDALPDVKHDNDNSSQGPESKYEKAKTARGRLKGSYTIERSSSKRKVTLDYLIDFLIPVGMHGLLYGDEQSLKTAVAVKIGVDIAMPTVAHHGDPKTKGIEYAIRRHGAVFYLALEDALGVKAKSREYIFDRKGVPEETPFYVLDGSFHITSEQEVDDLIADIEMMLKDSGVDLAALIIDTTVFSLEGDKSEDKSDTVTFAYNNAKRIIQHFKNKCTVLFIHHTGKDGGKGARGSSNWVKSSEYRYQTKPNGTKEVKDGNRTITFPASTALFCEKMKNMAKPQPVNYQSHRMVFPAERVDGDGKVTTIKDSVLLVDVATWEESKRTAGVYTSLDIVKILIDRERRGDHMSLADMALNADTYGLLVGSSAQDRSDSFRRSIKRLLDQSGTEDGPAAAMKFRKAVAPFLKVNVGARKGKGKGEDEGQEVPVYTYSFIGTGGRLGLWQAYQEAEAKRMSAVMAGDPEDDDGSLDNYADADDI